jgi:hypothetical protein
MKYLMVGMFTEKSPCGASARQPLSPISFFIPKLLPPTGAFQTSITYSLSDVTTLYLQRSLKVGNRARHFENTIVSAR